jgi:hypothetical protein
MLRARPAGKAGIRSRRRKGGLTLDPRRRTLGPQFTMAHEGLRSALACGGRGQATAEGAAWIAAALGWFWYLRGHLADGARWLEKSTSESVQNDSVTEPGTRRRPLRCDRSAYPLTSA